MTNIDTDEKVTNGRVLGRTIARELTDAELSSVAGGGSGTVTTANGCPRGDYDADEN